MITGVEYFQQVLASCEGETLADFLSVKNWETINDFRDGEKINNYLANVTTIRTGL